MPLKDKPQKKHSGVLCAVSSLQSKHGIGSFGIEAYRFVDFLRDSKQRFWQILPLNSLGEGNSPYKSISAYAGEILYIDLDILVHDGLLKPCDIPSFDFPQNVSYDTVRKFKIPLLKKAADNFNVNSLNYKKFLRENDFWLNDYALLRAAFYVYKIKSITALPDGLKYRLPDFLNEFQEKYEYEIDFYKITQYFFFCQYYELKRYANKNGINIIGDIPFYVAPDSADVWTNPDDFKLERDFTPTSVAGVPPDIFSDKGQLWGNPIYNWQNMKDNDYLFWRLRLAFCADMYDVLRIDHFRAFANYYEIPFGSKNAISGQWVKGDGQLFWDEIKETIGDLNIIAEDLGGEEDPGVINLLKHTDFPNMKILQFGFTGDTDNVYFPQNYPYNCVCYTGTHDNDTALGWYNSATQKEKVMLESLLEEQESCVSHNMIRLASQSDAFLCIIPMQDLLCLDSRARMNIPGVSSGNWQWRMSKYDINAENAQLLKRLTKERN